jgi:Protein of unknown function (DUF3143)
MTLLPIDTPLYNHPLPEIEQWLLSMGCEQDDAQLHCWRIDRSDWRAELCLEIEELTVRYFSIERSNLGTSRATTEERGIYRTFKYSLSRQDIENAVFAGP